MRIIRLILIFNLLFHLTISAQSPLTELIKQKKGDAKAIKELKEFEASGIQKQLNYGNTTSDKLVKQAEKYLNTPYKYGGYSKAGIDCSGLISKAFQDLGVEMPHSVQEMAKYGRIILDKNLLQPGDLIFFTKTYKTKNLISHAGIVINNGKMIHASSSKGVSIANINNPYYWDQYYLFGTRIFESRLSAALVINKTTSKAEKVSARIYKMKTDGKYTRSGKKFKNRKLNAIHATLPIGTKILVTNPKNGKQIKLMVAANGKLKADLALLISKKAARKLNIAKNKKAKVHFEVIK